MVTLETYQIVLIVAMAFILLLIKLFFGKEPTLKLWAMQCPNCTLGRLALIQPNLNHNPCKCGCDNLLKFNVHCENCGHRLWDDRTQKVINYREKKMKIYA